MCAQAPADEATPDDESTSANPTAPTVLPRDGSWWPSAESDPYRDNPAHREIADLQRRLESVRIDAAVLREARGTALRGLAKLDRDYQYAQRRHSAIARRALLGAVLLTASCVAIGYRLGSAPEGSSSWIAAVVLLVALVAWAFVLLLAVWTD